MRRLLILSSLVLIALLGLYVPAGAQAKSLYWDRFDVDVTVLSNGDLRVVETQQITFLGGPFHSGYATIPTDTLDDITNVEVWEQDQPYRQSNSEDEYTFHYGHGDDGLRVKWYFPYTSDSSHTFEFRYTVKGAIRRYPQGDELWWMAVPGDHDYSILSSRVSVRLPEGAAVNPRETGDDFVAETDGVPAEVSVSPDRRTVTAVATESLAPGEFLAVGVKFTPGVVGGSKPSWQAAYDRKVEWDTNERDTANLAAGVIGLLFLVGAPLGIYLLWYLRGRDPYVGLVVDVLSEPPSDLPPGAAGTLVDEKADLQDIVATLIDLARRGYLTMSEEGERKFGGLVFNRDFVFERTDQDQRDLRDYERKLLAGLFGSKKKRKLSQLKNKFYTHIPKVEAGLYETVVREGYFSDSPKQIRSRYATMGITLVFVAVGLGILAVVRAIEWVDAIWCPFVGLTLGAVMLAVVGQAMPTKTKMGAEAAARWRAFKRYLQQIDQYTEMQTATELFEKYLPYAIAFGLERSWVKKFAQVETMPIPTWYHPYWTTRHAGRTRRGSSGRAGETGSRPSVQDVSDSLAGSFQSMSDGLVSMFNSVGSTLTSQPSSSGSSGGGFSGGGFSGGGSSGGGSRGFG